jgi:hypothetical protein
LTAPPGPEFPIYLDVIPSDAAGLLVSHTLGLDPHAAVVAAHVGDVLNEGASRGRNMRHRLPGERRRFGALTKHSAR